MMYGFGMLPWHDALGLPEIGDKKMTAPPDDTEMRLRLSVMWQECGNLPVGDEDRLAAFAQRVAEDAAAIVQFPKGMSGASTNTDWIRSERNKLARAIRVKYGLAK